MGIIREIDQDGDRHNLCNGDTDTPSLVEEFLNRIISLWVRGKPGNNANGAAPALQKILAQTKVVRTIKQVSKPQDIKACSGGCFCGGKEEERKVVVSIEAINLEDNKSNTLVLEFLNHKRSFLDWTYMPFVSGWYKKI